MLPGNALFTLSRLTVDFLAGLVLRLRVHGVENIPREGAAIAAMNHASYLDPLLVGSVLGRVRPVASIGKKELFAVPILGAYLKAVGSIPLDRDKGDVRAMRAALESLRGGSLFLMAPEGTRGRSGRPRTPQPGVAFLAHRSKAPVLPVRIHGAGGIPHPGQVWLRIGKPLRFVPSAADPAGLRPQYQAFAEGLMRSIYAMGEERPVSAIAGS